VLWGKTAARGVLLDPGDTAFGEPVAPAADRGTSNTEFHGDVFVLPAVSGEEDNPGSLDQPGLRTTSPGPTLQGGAIHFGQRDCAGASHGHIPLS
jgi:hypothetical protein